MNEQNNKSFGAKPEIPSIRLYEYEKVCGASAKANNEYPETFCLNEVEMGFAVKDQGSIGACVACATSTAIEALILRDLLNLKEGEPITDDILKDKMNNIFGNDEISEGYTYGTCRQESSKSEGMIVTDALKYLTEKGTVPKKMFNYLNEMPDIKNIVNKYPELKEEALNYRIKGYVTMPSEKNAKTRAMKDALMKYRVPLVAVAPKKFGERHCICIVGWDDTKNAWIMKNSWGKDWENNGVGIISQNDISSEVYLLLANEIKLPFIDVKEDDWFYSAVKHVYMSDIMNGKSENVFDPNAPITRAEYATGISRLMKKIDERFENFNKILEEKNVFKDYKIK